MELSSEVWMKHSSMGCHTGAETIIELREDFFIREANGYVYEEEKISTHWERLEDYQIKELKDRLKKIDFYSLKNEYVDLGIMDGGSSKFNIYNNPVTKEVKIVNFYKEDPYFEQLKNLTNYLCEVSEFKFNHL